MLYALFLIFIVQFQFLFSNTGQPILNQSPRIEEGFIIHPDTTHEKIEYFLLKPTGEGPFPVIYIIHGSQADIPGTGAKQIVDSGYLQKFVYEGILAVAISMPGYGHSNGDRDFCGPHTQKAIAAVIDYFSHLTFVDQNRMGIYGISKGAILSSVIHNYYPHLMFQILEAGTYDLPIRRFQLPAYLEPLLQNMVYEAGNDEALKERSAVYHTHNVIANTLLLQGEIDDRKGLSSARRLHALLLSEGKLSKLKIFPKTPHHLSFEKWDSIIPFVRQNFFQIYGIGIKVTQSNPVIQVTEIYADSPADKIGKLQIGDAILGISPHNDDQEIDAINLPIQSFIPLVLGKKGTSLRLYVQHLDLSCEELVIERG